MTQIIKRIFSIVILLFCFQQISTVFSQSIKLNTKLHSGVKQCITYRYEYKFGEVNIDSKTKIESYAFDYYGNIIEYISYCIRPALTINEKKQCRYNSEGNMTEFIVYKSDGSILYKNTYKYDDRNNEIERDYYCCGISTPSITKHEYIYNEKNQEVEHVEYSVNTEPKDYTKHKFTYDNVGNVIEEKEYSYDGSISRKIKYKYNDNRKIIEETFLDDKDIFMDKRTYDYDAKGNLINEKWINKIGEVYVNMSRKYDLKGNLSEVVYYDEINEPTSKNVFEYN